ncbi:MAG TPA: BtpA/SgcQ family protein [Prolixibacteraceae bacterium]|nr:BtpA/SgcQ family protein [Prolixibacteraceae bacterium]
MFNLKSLSKAIIGMIHVAALPGTPKSRCSVQQIVDRAVREASEYLEAGMDALMIENMHDLPYLKERVGPEVISAMTAVACALRPLSSKPMGIQILAAANKEALAVALCSGFDFIRAEGFVFGHLADEGYIDGCAGELLRYRKSIDADHIAVFTDVKKKHSSHAITTDVSLSETIQAAEFFLSDGVIITGTSTGKEPSVNDVQAAHATTSLPVIIGSGISATNLEKFWPWADGFIIGSAFKKKGDWKNEVERERVMKLLEKVHMLRNNHLT